MKLMKSFLTLLLLGGMTFAGCNKKDQTPSGDEGGGGSGGDGGGVVDRFTNKRFDFESSDNSEIDEEYQGSYCSFFTEGDFEVVLDGYVATGDYTLSADKQSATMVMKGNKTADGAYPIPEQYWSTMPVEYVAATNKYVVTVTEEEMTAHLYYVLSSEAPVHYVFPQVQKVAVTFDANATDAIGSTATIEATPGLAFGLPECGFVRDGYEFQGWSLTTTGEELLEPHSSYTANVVTTFYAIWEAEAPQKISQYIETKSWFNAGGENEHVYVYAFKADSEPVVENAAFPGEEATYIRDLEDGKKLFSYDIEETFDTFIVVRVEGETNSYQTVNISLASLEGDNCVYLNAEAAPSSVETKIEVGHYNYVYAFGLSSYEGEITVGGHVDVNLLNVTGEVTFEVDPENSATVVINGNVATISSETLGESTITFADESEVTPTYTLTVSEAPSVNRVYIETKSWFNAGNDYEHVCVYAYKDGSNPIVENAAFPGEDASWVKDIDEGKKIFYFDLLAVYDTFVVSKVVDNVAVYQTVNISLADLGDDNCIYLNADSGSSAIPFGHYTFVPDVA